MAVLAEGIRGGRGRRRRKRGEGFTRVLRTLIEREGSRSKAGGGEESKDSRKNLTEEVDSEGGHVEGLAGDLEGGQEGDLVEDSEGVEDTD